MYVFVIGMESKKDLHDPTFMEKQDPSKDVLMEELSTIDPKGNSEEKSADFMNHSYFQSTYSGGTFTQSTLKNGKLGFQERKSNVFASRLVTAVVIVLIIGAFLVPIILYYSLKTDPIPELNSVLGEVNISMVSNCTIVYLIHRYKHHCIQGKVSVVHYALYREDC